MNRRDFLKATGAGAAAALVGDLLHAQGLTLADLQPFIDAVGAPAAEDYYYCYLHPDSYDLWKKAVARDAWYTAWTFYRRARRQGWVGDLEAREILPWLTSGSTLLPPSGPPLLHGELVRVEGVRFIETE